MVLAASFGPMSRAQCPPQRDYLASMRKQQTATARRQPFPQIPDAVDSQSGSGTNRELLCHSLPTGNRAGKSTIPKSRVVAVKEHDSPASISPLHEESSAEPPVLSPNERLA